MSRLKHHARKHMLGAGVIVSMFLMSLYKHVYYRGATWERGVEGAASFALLGVHSGLSGFCSSI
jgi:hypothetical protein